MSPENRRGNLQGLHAAVVAAAVAVSSLSRFRRGRPIIHPNGWCTDDGPRWRRWVCTRRQRDCMRGPAVEI